ncbi:16S rRNA (cytosine(1402)-N(4))-methyltransferase RsmH [bacterium]|nr:16S rRNA (cytosine(1402)-N(4))-methyltransferase RsmH [bacterium]
MEYHEPVLLTEVLERLGAVPGKIVCDGTLGSAGHGIHLVRALAGNGVFVGLDRDPSMLAKARERLAGEEGTDGVRLILEPRRYDELPSVLAENDLKGADAIILDLGFNSLQVQEGRGFGFSKDVPLDGRYNPKEVGTQSMAELVNTASEQQLRDWLWSYADERYARRIARRIVEQRERKPFETTFELAAAAEACYPAAQRHKGIHPATRTFQALRIATNRELTYAEQGIRACMDSLNVGGTLCVISFHSGEDKIAKRLFDEAGSPRPDPENPYSATTTEGLEFRVESRGAVKPSKEEIARNPRSRSARLRTIRRVGGKA